MSISNEQLVEILIGIARTHAAVLNATFDSTTVGQKIVPTLQGQAQILPPPGQPVSLQNIYPKLLLQTLFGPQRNAAPLEKYFGQELDKLIAKD